MKECREIQRRMKVSQSKYDGGKTAKIFARLILQGKITAALRYLNENGKVGVLNLSPEVLSTGAERKTSSPIKIQPYSLLFGPIDLVPNSVFDSVDETMIYKVVLATKGAGGPSNFDAEQHRRIVCSKNFSAVRKDLREQIALMTKKLCTKNLDPRCLEASTASRVIPFDKNPGVRLIGVGEVLRRIVGKSISWVLKEDIQEAAGTLQTCAGYKGCAEAVIHAMRDMFHSEDKEGVILIDASNAFYSLNRQVALHNIQILCPTLWTYVINIYRQSMCLFITGGQEINSQEGTTQGDKLAIAFYAIATTTIITSTRMSSPGINRYG